MSIDPLLCFNVDPLLTLYCWPFRLFVLGDTNTLVSAGRDSTLKFWDITTCKWVQVLGYHHMQMGSSFGISPHASGFKFWDITTCKWVQWCAPSALHSVPVHSGHLKDILMRIKGVDHIGLGYQCSYHFEKKKLYFVENENYTYKINSSYLWSSLPFTWYFQIMVL